MFGICERVSAVNRTQILSKSAKQYFGIFGNFCWVFKEGRKFTLHDEENKHLQRLVVIECNTVKTTTTNEFFTYTNNSDDFFTWENSSDDFRFRQIQNKYQSILMFFSDLCVFQWRPVKATTKQKTKTKRENMMVVVPPYLSASPVGVTRPRIDSTTICIEPPRSPFRSQK